MDHIRVVVDSFLLWCRPTQHILTSSRKPCMFRVARIFFFCLILFVGRPLRGSQPHAPWVSCFSQSSHHWEGAKTVRTPTITSPDGTQRAYAQIEAKETEPLTCENTVHLFVSTKNSADFRQVFMQKPSPLGGTANSVGPNSWSPDGRWLLVEFDKWFYDSDAGGLDVLLYDMRRGEIVSPDLTRIVQTKRKQECSIKVIKVIGFDASSRVRLQLADNIEEGEDQPSTHCFRKTEEWALDPAHQTVQFISRRP